MSEKILIETSASQVYTTDGNTVETELNTLNEKVLPTYSDSDESKILSIVNGTPTWITLQTYYTGTDDPTDDTGSDGDLYFKTST